MAGFVTVAKVGEIPEGKGRRFTVGEREIGFIRLKSLRMNHWAAARPLEISCPVSSMTGIWVAGTCNA